MALTSYGLTGERTKNSFIWLHCSPRQKETAKWGTGQHPSSGQFFTNYHDQARTPVLTAIHSPRISEKRNTAQATDFIKSECFQYVARNRYLWISLGKSPHTSIQSTPQKTSGYSVSSETLTQIEIVWERKFSWKQWKTVNKRSIYS